MFGEASHGSTTQMEAVAAAEGACGSVGSRVCVRWLTADPVWIFAGFHGLRLLRGFLSLEPSLAAVPCLH